MHNLDRVDIISNRVGKYDEFTQAKIVKLFANQVCVVQNIAMKLKAEINHIETTTKKMGYGINMFRNAFPNQNKISTNSYKELGLGVRFRVRFRVRLGLG